MAEYVCKEHERKFEVRPVGVQYICEFCNEGQMLVQHRVVKIEDIAGPHMFDHVCNNCGKHMQLPQAYPKIEWEVLDDGNGGVVKL